MHFTEKNVQKKEYNQMLSTPYPYTLISTSMSINGISITKVILHNKVPQGSQRDFALLCFISPVQPKMHQDYWYYTSHR